MGGDEITEVEDVECDLVTPSEQALEGAAPEGARQQLDSRLQSTLQAVEDHKLAKELHDVEIATAMQQSEIDQHKDSTAGQKKNMAPPLPAPPTTGAAAAQGHAAHLETSTARTGVSARAAPLAAPYYKEDRRICVGLFNPGSKRPRSTSTASSSGRERTRSHVRSQITDLEPLPFTPKTVSTPALPNDALLRTNRANIERMLLLYGLKEVKVAGDGNCQFRALSDQIYRDPGNHMYVRDCIISQLKKHADHYRMFVHEGWASYLARMSRSGEWGDHVTLQAASDFFGTQINLLTSYDNEGYIEVKPKEAKSERELWLSFWAEVHYNSLYCESDVATAEFYSKRAKSSTAPRNTSSTASGTMKQVAAATKKKQVPPTFKRAGTMRKNVN